MYRGEPVHGYTIFQKEEKMQTQKFIRKPFEIEGVRVTPENLEEVADWCQGDIVGNAETETRYIKVRVHHPLTERQTKAFVGDWVLYAGKGYKVYTDKAFTKHFDPVEEQVVYTMEDAIAQCGEDPDQLPLEGVTIVQNNYTSTDEAIRQMVEADQK